LAEEYDKALFMAEFSAAPLAAPASAPAKCLRAQAEANNLVEFEAGRFEGTYDNVQATVSALGPFALDPFLRQSNRLTIEPHASGLRLTAAAVVDYVEERVGSQGRSKAPLVHYLPPPKGWRKEGKRSPVYAKIVADIAPDQRPIEDQLAEADAEVRVSRNGQSAKGLSYWQQCKQPGSEALDWFKFPVARVETRLRSRVSSEYAQHLTTLAEECPFHEDSRPLFDGGRWDLVKRVLHTGLRLKCKPLRGGSHATWLRLWSRAFGDLDGPLRSDPWAKANKIKTGGKYGFLWLAVICQKPELRLPYLFWCSEQNAGKSIIHESIHAHLFDCSSADLHLSGEKFNAHLADSPLAYIEETNLGNAKGSSQKIRQLVTAGRLSKRAMYTDQVEVNSYLHFVQCSNRLDALPIPWGDTRTVCLGLDALKKAAPADNAQLADDMAAIQGNARLSDEDKCKLGAARLAKVPTDTLIPRSLLDRQLAREAPYFVGALKSATLPPPVDRLALLAIETDMKRTIMLADVADVVVEIVDWATKQKTLNTRPWTGTTKELLDSTGIRANADRRKLASDCRSESGRQYLADHGIEVEFPKEHTKKGYLVTVSKSEKTK